jgi:hypothetical protein
VVAAALVGALVAYAAIAADVVEGGWLSSLDDDLSAWIARSMPAIAEWPARGLSWIGGWIGTTLIVAWSSSGSPVAARPGSACC